MSGWPTLAVVGAINVDLVVSGAPLPAPGATVVGGTFAQHHGGKGGNQAVAAARALNASRADDANHVVMIGAVGADDLGQAAVNALAAEGIHTYVHEDEGAPTGAALIVVDERGENQVSVAPGANDHLTDRIVAAGLANYAPGLVLASLEVPEAAVRAAAEWCWAHDVPFVLNPAPARLWVRDLLGLCAYVTPNEGERSTLGEIPEGVTVVETRGQHGATIGGDGTSIDVPAPEVRAVDATGAGDCFNGVFAAGLLEGLDPAVAVRRAVMAASISVTRAGAREGMPSRADIDAALD